MKIDTKIPYGREQVVGILLYFCRRKGNGNINININLNDNDKL